MYDIKEKAIERKKKPIKLFLKSILMNNQINGNLRKIFYIKQTRKSLCFVKYKIFLLY